MNKVSKMEEEQKHREGTLNIGIHAASLKEAEAFLEEWAEIFENNLLVKEKGFF